MSHARQVIREAIATILNTMPTLWTRAHETRVPSPRQVWPYLMVFAVNDASLKQTIHPTSIYDREVTINVIGMLRLPGSGDTQTIEDKMDAVASGVETKLTHAAMQAIVPNVLTFYLESTALDVVVTEEDAVDHAEITMVYRASYAINEGAPDTLI